MALRFSSLTADDDYTGTFTDVAGLADVEAKSDGVVYDMDYLCLDARERRALLKALAAKPGRVPTGLFGWGLEDGEAEMLRRNRVVVVNLFPSRGHEKKTPEQDQYERARLRLHHLVRQKRLLSIGSVQLLWGRKPKRFFFTPSERG